MWVCFNVNNKQRIFCEFTDDETIDQAREFLMRRFHFRPDMILSLSHSTIESGCKKLSSLADSGRIPEFSVSATEDTAAASMTEMSLRRPAPRRRVFSPEDAEFLVRLGFGEVAAKIALMDADGDVDAAIRMLADDDVGFLPGDVEELDRSDLAAIARIAARRGIAGRTAAMGYLAAGRSEAAAVRELSFAEEVVV
jgi:hypothetical protein